MLSRRIGWYATWTLGAALAFMVAFIGAFILMEVAIGALVADVEAFFESAVPAAAGLTVAFALGGAALGLVQWALVRRRVPDPAAWIGALALGFAAVALLYSAFVELVGEALANEPLPRLVNEVGHNLAAGALAGWTQWRFVLSHLGVSRRAWTWAMGGAFVAAGMSAWAVEAGLGIEAGAAAPLGILVLTIVSAVAWHRLVEPRGDAPADAVEAAPA